MTSKRTITLPPLHPAQFEIARSNARFRVISAGRRFGKGILGISECFRRGIKGKKCRWIAPSYASDSYQAGWGMAVNLASQIQGVEVHQQRKEFKFTKLGGAWLQFRTAEEPDALRGEGIDFAIFDEAAHVKGLREIWEQAVRPSLMDRHGEAWFISTPHGHNYFADLFKRGDGRDKEWQSFHYATGSNPHIDPREIEALRRDMPALVARQEIDAEFVQLAGALFKRDMVRLLDEEPQGVRWVRSWDLAFTKKTTSDWTAGARAGLTADGTLVVADVVRGRWEWPQAVRMVAETARLDGVAVRQGVEVVGAQVGFLDTLMVDPLLTRFSFEPIQVHNDKLTRALPAVARCEQGRLAVVRGGWTRAFLDELSAFTGSDDDAHDDQVDALSGATVMIGTPTGAFTSSDQMQTRVRGDFAEQFTSERITAEEFLL